MEMKKGSMSLSIILKMCKQTRLNYYMNLKEQTFIIKHIKIIEQILQDGLAQKFVCLI